MHIKQIFILLMLIIIGSLTISASDPPPSIEVTEQGKMELSIAFNEKFESFEQSKSLIFDLFNPEVDTAFTTMDGSLAVIWLALRDDKGRILATEPGLVIASKTENGWKIILPGETGWEELFASIPEEMLPVEQRTAPDGVIRSSDISQPEALTGYYLPYAAGTKQWLEGSISHFFYIPELGYPSCSWINGVNPCRYAYDFTNIDHFPLLASKGGTVYASRDSCNDGDENCTNYIVLSNSGKAPYQIYLHLSHNTIPDKLTDGTSVVRGQYLGDTDDTGYSTSNHVHFMVTDSIWAASGYYWGYSTDIRFEDVSINGGIPRTCYEVTSFPIYDGATECIGNTSDPRNPNNDWFVSGNIGAFPPTGTLTRPTEGAVVTTGTNPVVDVTATASDDVRVKAVSLVAKLNDQWVEIGPKVTQAASPGTYDWDVDLCAVGPLNGPLEVAVRIWDHEGNVASALNPRTILVDHACPPASSSLDAPDTFDSTAIKLNWSATSNWAEIGEFEIQWRTDPGSWEPGNMIYVTGTQRSTWFVGKVSSSYAFRIRSIDVNGQIESWPENDAAEITVTLPSTCSTDGFETDDSSATAHELTFGEVSSHNLCGLLDSDWVSINIGEADYYQFNAYSVDGGAAVRLKLFASDGVTILGNAAANGIGTDIRMTRWIENPGLYYLKAEPLDENLVGTEAVYDMQYFNASVVFLPLVSR